MAPSRFLIAYLVLPLLFCGCHRGIPIVGLDENGQERAFQIYEEKFSEQAGLAINTISQSVANAEKSAAKDEKPKMGIHLVSVGVGVVGGIDTSPAPITLLVQPRIRFLFTDLENPQSP